MRKILILVAAVVALVVGGGVAHADVYDNYNELKRAKVLGVDYRITEVRPVLASTRAAHIAIHGGLIEAGTTQLALEAAHRMNCVAYSFEGIQKKDNHAQLHITATHFDEPRAEAMVAASNVTVSWHGVSGEERITHVGGADTDLADRVRTALKNAGFTVARSTPDRIDGDDPRNIANRNARGKGLQLEISTAQRNAFFKGAELDLATIENPANRTPAFFTYIDAVNSALPIAVGYEDAPR
ncbi:poly-gamma-glutamate hydrolase family protein [Nocardia sp. NPDC052566]|uniref:poly-gamma-glutamate hydrolase family protein n=1 Tax=Nocardia sp. NPDC052566 TaxID=3364330 RepID=UPI0037C9AD90